MKHHNRQIPRFSERLLGFLCKKEYLEEILGDLAEYHDELRGKSKWQQSIFYWFHVLQFLRLWSLKKVKITQKLNQYSMFKNMFKVAWRNAIRHGQFTFLNLMGLTVGIATCLIIGIYIHQEKSFDNFHTKGNRIYRVNQPDIWNDWTAISSSTGPNVGVALKEDIPEFEEVTRLLSLGSQIINYQTAKGESRPFREDDYMVVEENFFDIFSFQFLEGTPTAALKDPMSMVVTKATAERYFGLEKALDKSLKVKDWDGSWKTLTIKGVIQNIPYNSHLQFDMLVSMNSYQEMLDRDGWKWIWTAFSTYGLVNEGVDVNLLTQKIQAVPPKWAPPTTERIFNQTFDEFTAGNPWTLYLQPLEEIYLSEAPNAHRFGPTGDPQKVRIFTIVGVLILILSAINFMNLSTARSANRAKEVGVRKVLGSARNGLIRQFIFESTLYVFASTLAALILLTFLLKQFNQLAEIQIELSSYLSQPWFLSVLVIFVLTLGFAAGSYPAFYLSAFKPIESLKGRLSSGMKGKGLRNTLVVIQFTLSIILVSCAFFVQKQLKHLADTDTGFQTDNILQIHNIEQFGFDSETLKNSLLANPAFEKIGKSFGVPPYVWSGDRYKAADGENEVVNLSNIRVDEDYLDVLALNFIAGRSFDANRPTDKYGVILNEEAVKTLGWNLNSDLSDHHSPIGKKVAVASGTEDEFTVIGVVKNFNFNGVKERIEPLIIIHHHNDKVWDYGAGLSFFSIRLNQNLISSNEEFFKLTNEVQVIMEDVDPSVPFEFSLMDQGFEETLRTDRRLGRVLNVFTIIAIFIACLGLFGLAAFAMEQRTRELGIRKVLGARISELLILFSSEFTRLILFSIILASTASYFLIDEWLKDFASRTSMDWWVFIIIGFTVLLLAVITISSQSLRAALANPVKSLRNE